MTKDPINQARYRTLLLALALIVVAAAGGGIALMFMPQSSTLEWVIHFAIAGVGLAAIPVAIWLREQNQRDHLLVLAKFIIGMAAVLLLQRMAWSAYGPMIRDPSLSLFRPHYAFVPFLYIGAVAIHQAREALRLCWTLWSVQLLIVLPALILFTGFDLDRNGMVMLLMWLVAANPLFIALLHALPHYEEALSASATELEAMRGRLTLSEQLQESERRFNLVVEGLQVGVWDIWLSQEGKHWWSPRLYELIGFAPDELPPSLDSQKRKIHPKDWERVQKESRAQLRRGDIIDVDYRVATKSRGYRWFRSHGKAARDAGGRVVRITGAVTDIHDQRKAEEDLEQARKELERIAYHDPTTNLNNRRAFDEKFFGEWQRSVRYSRPLSLLLIDLDHFKAYNDTKGHAAGDVCLERIAREITKTVRGGVDFVARVGGEEFAVILPETPADGAVEVGRKVQSAIRRVGISHPGSPMEIVTVSIGVSSLKPPSSDNAIMLYEQADRALYHIKRCGRDDVLHIQSLATSPGAAA